MTMENPLQHTVDLLHALKKRQRNKLPQNLGDEAMTIAMDYRQEANRLLATAKRKELEAIELWAKAEQASKA